MTSKIGIEHYLLWKNKINKVGIILQAGLKTCSVLCNFFKQNWQLINQLKQLFLHIFTLRVKIEERAVSKIQWHKQGFHLEKWVKVKKPFCFTAVLIISTGDFNKKADFLDGNKKCNLFFVTSIKTWKFRFPMLYCRKWAGFARSYRCMLLNKTNVYKVSYFQDEMRLKCTIYSKSTRNQPQTTA